MRHLSFRRLPALGGAFSLCCLLFSSACAKRTPPQGVTDLQVLGVEQGYHWSLPRGFPIPLTPLENPMTPAKVELGRRLFYETRLSVTGAYSCASCHRQELAFTDGRAHAAGATGELHPRSAMSLTNVAYNLTLTWADPGVRTLETQALVPMLNVEPVELGLEGREKEVVAALAADSIYQEGFRRAFPEIESPISFVTIARALASFERTLLSFNSAYDRLVFLGEEDALDRTARKGMELFFSEKTGCSKCHSGINFSGPVVHRAKLDEESRFHNTGLYNLSGRGYYPAEDQGLFKVTRKKRDMGAFRAPTLRNVALTAPYMHDGSISSLEVVIDHYAAGGRTIVEGPSRGVGRDSRYKDRLLRGFQLDPGEREALVAFLESLTDWDFVRNPEFAALLPEPK